MGELEVKDVTEEEVRLALQTINPTSPPDSEHVTEMRRRLNIWIAKGIEIGNIHYVEEIRKDVKRMVEMELQKIAKEQQKEAEFAEIRTLLAEAKALYSQLAPGASFHEIDDSSETARENSLLALLSGLRTGKPLSNHGDQKNFSTEYRLILHLQELIATFKKIAEHFKISPSEAGESKGLKGLSCIRIEITKGKPLIIYTPAIIKRINRYGDLGLQGISGNFSINGVYSDLESVHTAFPAWELKESKKAP